MKIQPKILIISFNYNDRRYVLSNDDIDNTLNFQRKYDRIKKNLFIKILKSSYLYRSIQFLFKKIGIKKAKNEKINITHLEPRVNPKNYRNNLINIVELAREKNIHVIFLMLKDNPIHTTYLRKVIRALEDLDYESAIEYLTIVTRNSPWFSDIARLHIAEAYKNRDVLLKILKGISY